MIVATAAAVLELPQWDQGLMELYGRFGQFPYLCEVVRDMATNIYRAYKEDPVVTRLEDFLVEVYSSAGVDKSRIRNQLRQGRIRTQLAAQGLSADEREPAIDGVITDASGLD